MRQVVWRVALRHYLAVVLPANLAWEIAHLPLYTMWSEASFGQMAPTVVYCTVGDSLLASTSFMIALLLFGHGQWPTQSFATIAVFTLALGLAATILIEWLATQVLNRWAYADLMPRLPLIGTGLSPLLQWVVIPLAGLWWARRKLVAPGP